MASNAPTFSYAAAAKGQATPPAASQPKDTEETAPQHSPVVKAQDESIPPQTLRKTSLSTSVTSEQKSEEPTTTATATAQESSAPPHIPNGPEVEGTNQTVTAESDKKADVQLDAQSSVVSQTPSSINEQSAAGKDKDAVPNDPSDTTWEKLSQLSQSDDKTATGAPSEDAESKTSWEHVSAQELLKEAPLPAINIWQKRAQEAKARNREGLAEGAPNDSRVPKASPPIGARGHAGPKAANGVSSPAGTVNSMTSLDGTAQTPGGNAGSSTRHQSRPSHSNAGNSNDSNRSKYGSAHPPSPNDAGLWPSLNGTHEDIHEDDKKKSPIDRSDRGDKEKVSKAHGKEKWVQVPYVPTAVFNTPLPSARRGGRGGARGGRDAGGRGAAQSSGGDRSVSGASNRPTAASSTYGQSQIRSSGTTGPADEPSANDTAHGDAWPSGESSHAKNSQALKSDENEQTRANNRPSRDSRRMSTSTQTDSNIAASSQNFPPDSMSSSASTSGQMASERRSDFTSTKSPEFSREGASFRGETSRADRTRGGYRAGRNSYSGGANGSTTNSMSNGYGAAPYGAGKSHSQHDPRLSSPIGNNSFGLGRESRHNRGTSRSQSVMNGSGFARHSVNNGSYRPPSLADLQLDTSNPYGYQPTAQGVMSAINFHPYMEQMQLQGMVQFQMEYYFSVDNLLKDMFLRRQMDSQGFVFLHVLQNFNRIKQLTTDAELLRWVCLRSAHIELQTGLDGLDRIRASHDWQQWVLPMADRDPAARHDGPALASPPIMPAYSAPMSPEMMSQSFQYTPNPGYDSFLQHTSPPTPDRASVSQVMTNGHHPNTPLSAAVPDFTPGTLATMHVDQAGLKTSAVSDDASQGQPGQKATKTLPESAANGHLVEPAVKSPPLSNGTHANALGVSENGSSMTESAGGIAHDSQGTIESGLNV